jgi:hypothetical protein
LRRLAQFSVQRTEIAEVILFAAFVADAMGDGEGLLVEVNGARQASSGLRTAAGPRFNGRLDRAGEGVWVGWAWG